MRDAVIIGAGISGLVAAYRLKSLGADVLLLESSSRTGGVIRSDAVAGYLIERGPNSSQGTEELLALVEELGIKSEMVEGDPKAPAYVCHGGRLHPVPTGPGAFLKSGLLSPMGKLRLLGELFVPPRRDEEEESVASFARRRIGREAAERMIGAFVSGVYAGDADRLSVQAAFPKMVQLERGYGGLFRGMIGKMREAKKNQSAQAGPRPRRACSFRKGMGFLTDTLAQKMGEELILGCSDIDLKFESSNFKLSFARAGGREEIKGRSVIVSAPAFAASRLVAPLSPEISRLLDEIEYPPLSIVYLSYDHASIEHPLSGFGFLAAPGEGLKVLGSVWNSSLFEGRAPKGKVLLTVFIGGARTPELARLKDDELVATAHGELQKLLRISGEPRSIGITRHERAIPQYNLGHAARVKKIDELLNETPGLYLAGNYMRGPSTGDCIKEADRVARLVAAYCSASC